MDAKGLRALFRVLVGISCVLALVSGVPAGAVADSGAVAGTVQEESTERERLDAADSIHIDVFVHENGSATFVVDYRFENNSSGEWESLREDVEANTEAYVASQERRWNETVAEGRNATEREEMELRNVSVSTDTSSVSRDMGHVKVRFEWVAFAYVELNRIEVEDSLTGFTLSHDTSLQIFAPEGYVIEEVSPAPGEVGESEVRWASEADPFSSDSPQIVMIEESTDEGPPTESADTESESGPPMRWAISLAALAVLATVGVAGWWMTRTRGTGSTTGAVDPTVSSANGSGGSPADDSPPPELLSNEERVLRLLKQRGGRIKQQEVVSELDWTEAKTSQVVSGLREDDEIEVFRIGRENVLSLPTEEEQGEERI